MIEKLSATHQNYILKRVQEDLRDLQDKYSELRADLQKQRANPLLDDRPKRLMKKLSIENVNRILKAGMSTKVVRCLNDCFEDPNELFEPVAEKQEPRPEFNISDDTIIDEDGMTLGQLRALIKDAGVMNPLMKGPRPVAEKQGPKWKPGDIAWYIEFGNLNAVKDWEVDWCNVAMRDIKNLNMDTNYFKTKESAEAALAEIKQIMEKYE